MNVLLLSIWVFFLIIRNLFPEDGKLKDGKTPEPTYIDDVDGKDTGPKGRRSRGKLS